MAFLPRHEVRRVRDIKFPNFSYASTFLNEGFTKGDDFRITIDERSSMMLLLCLPLVPLSTHSGAIVCIWPETRLPEIECFPLRDMLSSIILCCPPRTDAQKHASQHTVSVLSLGLVVVLLKTLSSR